MDKLQEQKKISVIKKYLKYFQALFLVVVFVFIFLGQVSTVKAANLFLSPATGNYSVGKTFSVSVFVSSSGKATNAVSGTISFSADKLEISSISKSGSILSLWAQEPNFSNSAGSVSFEGIIMNPGFSGSSGKIMTINFKTKAAGQANISFSSGSALANDGLGTNILNGLAGAKISISAPTPQETVVVPPSPEPEKVVATEVKTVPGLAQVSSKSNPDQQQWYTTKDIEASWSLPAGVNGESVYLNQNPNFNPAAASDGLFTSKAYKNTEDGVWYFHIKLRNKNGWGEVSHFRFQIDSTPPKPFDIELLSDKGQNVQLKLVNDAVDELSGIDHYIIEYGYKESIKLTPAEINVNKPFSLPILNLQKQVIKVSAYDKAGNFTSASTEFTPSLPVGTELKVEPIVNEKVTSKEAVSQPSNVFDFNGKFYEAGARILRALVLLISIISLLLLLIFLLRYAWYKFFKLNIKAAEEIRLAKKSFQKELAKSRKDIQDRIIVLEKNRIRRQKVEEIERKILAQLELELTNLNQQRRVVKVATTKKVKTK